MMRPFFPKTRLIGLAFVMALPCMALFSLRLQAQDSTHLTLPDALRLARQNYPQIRQMDLIRKTGEYTISNAAKGYLPQFSVNGQATYQSEVTNIPIKVPGFTIPSLSKDQYKIYGEVDQVIYDGGLIHNQKQLAGSSANIQAQNLEVELYGLADRINQLFFGAMLADEQIRQNDLVKKDIQDGIIKTRALVENGVAYRSNLDELNAQLLTTDQNRIDLAGVKNAYVAMLSVFVGKPLDASVKMDPPPAPAWTDQITRPELTLLQYQKQSFDIQDQLLAAQLRPRFSFFVQGGYARPALNLLSNQFDWYYLGGLRLSWNLGSWYTLHNSRTLNQLNRQSLDLQRETFLFNTQISQRQQMQNISKYQELMKSDNEIIALRESVKKAAAAQLENGVISANDYILQVNAEDRARTSLILHRVEWLHEQYNYQNTIGNLKF